MNATNERDLVEGGNARIRTSKGSREEGPAVSAPLERNASQLVTVQAFVTGYRRAVVRVKDAIELGEPAEESFLPLFEALNWAVSLDDRLGYLDVPVAKGLRWVRNLVHHEWADALEPVNVPIARTVRAVGHSQAISPAVLTVWYWRPIVRLPELDERFRDKGHEPEQRKAYIAELAKQGAEEPLERFLDAIDAIGDLSRLEQS